MWAGDIDNNGSLDIYFSNYVQNSGQGGVLDVLLINDGNGFFADESQSRLGIFSNWQNLSPAAPYMFRIEDFEDNGLNDLYIIDNNSDFVLCANFIFIVELETTYQSAQDNSHKMNVVPNPFSKRTHLNYDLISYSQVRIDAINLHRIL